MNEEIHPPSNEDAGPPHAASAPTWTGTPVLPPLTARDLQPVRLVRRWSSTPPPHAEIRQLWHFWPELKQLNLPACFALVRSSSTYVLGTLQRYEARWWQIRAEEQGLELQIEEL